MTDINTATVMGRLTKDGKLSYTKSGTAKLDFSIAVNESRKNGDQWEDYANFFDVAVWGKSAETLYGMCNKGAAVVVTGHLQQQRWEKNGQTNSKVVIIADVVRMAGSKPQQKNEPQASQQNYQQQDTNGGFVEDIQF